MDMDLAKLESDEPKECAYIRVSIEDLKNILLALDHYRKQVKNLQEASTKQLLEIRNLKALIEEMRKSQALSRRYG